MVVTFFVLKLDKSSDLRFILRENIENISIALDVSSLLRSNSLSFLLANLQVKSLFANASSFFSNVARILSSSSSIVLLFNLMLRLYLFISKLLQNSAISLGLPSIVIILLLILNSFYISSSEYISHPLFIAISISSSVNVSYVFSLNVTNLHSPIFISANPFITDNAD